MSHCSPVLRLNADTATLLMMLAPPLYMLSFLKRNVKQQQHYETNNTGNKATLFRFIGGNIHAQFDLFCLIITHIMRRVELHRGTISLVQRAVFHFPAGSCSWYFHILGSIVRFLWFLLGSESFAQYAIGTHTYPDNMCSVLLLTSRS